MPGPFPGMDPYLEGSDFWAGFHNRFLMYAADDLQPQLPANYVATVEVRNYLENLEGGNGQSGLRMPDLEVIRVGSSSSWPESSRVEQVPRGGVLVAPDLLEQREAYVLIRYLPSGELVTSLELLSPANKQPGEGREQYRRKQQQLATAGVNLVEIDLLRGGSHTTLPREEALLELPPFHYLASIYRATASEQCQVFTGICVIRSRSYPCHWGRKMRNLRSICSRCLNGLTTRAGCDGFCRMVERRSHL